MQEIKKRRILLASILKPVNEVRMYEKLARSLYQAGYVDIHLVGFPAPTDVDHLPGNFHPLRHFNRLSWRRYASRWTILKLTLRLRPDLLIVTTHELLMMAVLIRWITGCRIVYDIQENYYENILASESFFQGLRMLVANAVRFKERLLCPCFDAIFLAEKGYALEMPFVAARAIVLENKCILPPDFVRKPSDSVTLLFSGTLATSTGVFEAIRLVEELHALNSAIRLNIVGHCAHRPTWEKLQHKIENVPYITLTGGLSPVPHTAILDAISRAHFGIICYPHASHVRNRIPTKLYEYLACRLPIILEDRPQWTRIAHSVNGCIPIDFTKIDIQALDRRMQIQGYARGPVEEYLWKGEESRLLEKVGSLIR